MGGKEFLLVNQRDLTWWGQKRWILCQWSPLGHCGVSMAHSPTSWALTTSCAQGTFACSGPALLTPRAITRTAQSPHVTPSRTCPFTGTVCCWVRTQQSPDQSTSLVPLTQWWLHVEPGKRNLGSHSRCLTCAK